MENEKSSRSAEAELQLILEGRNYVWPVEFITGLQVKEMGAIPLESELYLAVKDPWKDELISNDARVNLARPEIEHFYVKRKLRYTINGVQFESDRQYVKGQTIRQQGKIPDDHEIFLSIQGPWDDERVKNDEFVDLARPSIEHFYSKEVKVEVIIIVDGSPKKWEKKQITFVEVIILAFDTFIDQPTMVYTVAFEDGPKENPEGSMTRNSIVFVKNKMIFHATASDKS